MSTFSNGFKCDNEIVSRMQSKLRDCQRLFRKSVLYYITAHGGIIGIPESSHENIETEKNIQEFPKFSTKT